MTEEKQQELATTERKELVGYGQIDDVKEMFRRIRTMVPNANKMDDTAVLALAQVSVALSLNPITGEVWAIPQQGNTYAIMAGIKGLRKAARVAVKAQDKDGTYYTDQRLATEEETHGTTINEGDIVRACDLYILTTATVALMQITKEPVMFTGLGIFRKNEKTRMEPVMVARKRAEADALKQAFDLSALTGYQPEPPTAWELADQARDNALPFVPRSRGRNDPFKETRDPHEIVAAAQRRLGHEGDPCLKCGRPMDAMSVDGICPGAADDVVEGEVIESTVDESDRFGFYDRMLDAIPFFKSRKDLLAALAENDMTLYHPQYESVMQEYLEEYASEKANAEAAAEGQAELAL